MNINHDNKYAAAIDDFLNQIGFSADRVDAVNITNGFIEVSLSTLPHADPALSTNTVITINVPRASHRLSEGLA